MRKVFFIATIFFLLGVLTAFSADDKFVLVIDAGHGGRDAGAVRGSYKEKSINLGVALALGKMIESNMKNVKVVYTRKTDTFIDLYKRAEIANKAKANLFISIHTNSTASKTTTAQGADTYILGLAKSEENLAVAKRENSVILLEDNYKKRYEGFDPNSPESYIIFEFMTDKYMEQSLDFATHVQRGFPRIAKRRDRGVRQAGFLVLRESAMPSVLIELGFINNPSEAKYLSSSTGQRSMASSIYSGIEKYVKDFNKKRGKISAVPETSTRTATTSPSSGRTTTAPVTKAESEAVRRNKNTVSKEPELMPPLNSKKSTEKQKTTVADRKKETRDIALQPVKEDKENITPPVVTKPREVTVREAENESKAQKTSEPQRQETGPKILGPVTPEAPSSKVDGSSGKESNAVAAGQIEYRVQFLISQKKIPAKSPAFKGLSPVKEYRDQGIYKYTYGSTDNETEALRIRAQVRKLFKDAFVVKFRDGVRIM